MSGERVWRLAGSRAIGALALVVAATLVLANGARAAAPVYSEAAHSGGYYGTTSTSSPGGGAFEDMSLSTSPGQLVCASAWVRSDFPATGAAGSFVVWLLGGRSDGGSTSYSGLGNLGAWTQVQTCVEATTAHSGLRVQFYPAIHGPTLDMDDIDVHKSLVPNGGFEQGGSGWAAYPNTHSNFSVYQPPAGAPNAPHSGGAFAATNTSEPGGGIYQDVALNTSAGQLVCGSAWVRTEGSGSGAAGSFVLWLLGGSGENSVSVPFSGLPPDHVWTQVQTCVQATGSHKTLRIQFYPQRGTPTLEIDDVDVHESLVSNGGFEQGGSGWAAYPNTQSNFSVYQAAGTAPNAPHSGSSFAATNTAQPGGGIYQDVALNTSPRQLVCGSAWVRTEGAGTGAAGSFALWLLGRGYKDSSSVPFGNLPPNHLWTQVQTCVEATHAHSTLRIQFYPQVGTPTLEIDDVDVHESLAANGGLEYGSGPWSTYPNTNSTFDAVRTHDVFGPIVTTPQKTMLPRPRGRRALKVRLSLSWTWDYGTTRLVLIRIGSFPRHTRLTVQCLGRGCSHRRQVARGKKAIHRLLHRLRGRSFQVGERLRLTLSAPRYKSERAEVVFRYARLPLARLVR